VDFVEETLKRGGMFDALPAVAVAACVFWVSALRGGVMAVFSEADEDDDAGVQGLISWAEDLWALVGPAFLILFPLVMVTLIGAVAGLMLLARKRAEAKEEQSKVPCAGCGAPTYSCAVACAACGTAVETPHQVGVLGQSKPEPTTDIAGHPHRLVEKKRCPVCAARFTERAARQTCGACGHELMADAAFSSAYLDRIGARLPSVLGVCLVLSLIPILGLIPGVIYYRLALVAPFRRYIPRGRSLLMRWTIRIFFLVLIATQWVPGLGGVVVPIMAFVNYKAYRSMYESSLSEGAPGQSAA
jgi:hypothetical protein